MRYDNSKVIIFNNLREIGGGGEIPFISYHDEQNLTEVEKNNVLTKLGIADERVNLTINCAVPSAIIGAVVTVTYDGNTQTYTWQGTTLTIIIPMMEEYTISFSQIPSYYKPDDITYISKKNRVRNITVSYNSAPYTDLSMVDINGNALSSRETANCYVVKSTGYYEFPIVYGNGIMSGETNSASFTQLSGSYTQPFFNYLNNQITSPFIEDDTNNEVESANVVYTDSSDLTISSVYTLTRGICKYVRFQVDAMPSLGGNAIIAVKDENNQIMWSWHIWAYPFTLTTKAHTNPNNKTYNLLDVNLGWVKHATDSKYGTCPYYQWGRKDPMLRANDYNSNTQAIPIGGTFSISSCANSLAATIQNPNVFNTQESSHYNWWSNNGTAVDFYNYWDASQTTTGNVDKVIVKTIYDPCPVGFSIPCGNTFLGYTKDNGGTWDYGWTWDERYFSASGYRDSGSGGVGSVGSDGLCWLASSSSQSRACSLNFHSAAVYPQRYYNRAFGFAVVPVAY